MVQFLLGWRHFIESSQGVVSMVYKEMRNVFHAPADDERVEYERRLNDPRTIKIRLEASDAPFFVCMVPEVYESVIAAEKLDKEIYKLEECLPGRALDSYTESLLIDEIVLTNEIEGVNSTKREISDTLERLKANDRKGRFAGIVQKYGMLKHRGNVPLSSCEDVRALYDDLVLPEVIADDPDNAPDGELFRRNDVHVVDAGGMPIHDGVMPESRIMDGLEQSLRLLNDESVPMLVRTSLFHFLFGYIHPFYDGNGRMNRFISAYMISREYEPLCAFGLSYAVKQNIRKYYKAYTTCEHALNKGDLTPFVISFSEIVIDAMSSLRDALVKREELFRECCEAILLQVPEGCRLVTEALITGTLFAFHGVTVADLIDAHGISRQTAYKRMEPAKEMGLLVREKVGRQTYYHLDYEKLKEKVEARG